MKRGVPRALCKPGPGTLQADVADQQQSAGDERTVAGSGATSVPGHVRTAPWQEPSDVLQHWPGAASAPARSRPQDCAPMRRYSSRRSRQPMRRRRPGPGSPPAAGEGRDQGEEVDEGIWLVSFVHYDLGYFDLEPKTLQPLDNPFGTRLSPMSWVRSVTDESGPDNACAGGEGGNKSRYRHQSCMFASIQETPASQARAVHQTSRAFAPIRVQSSGKYVPAHGRNRWTES